MTCAEFQRVLPYIIETGGNAEEEEHLHDCTVCSDLVRDLRYIAEQAKLLVPMEDPSPKVWDGIQKSLEREGLVKSKGLSRSMTTLRAGVLAVVGVLALFMLARTQREANAVPVMAQTNAVQTNAAATADDGDAQLLAALHARQPAVRSMYEQNLREVNRSLRETQERVRREPGNESAQRQLMHSYEQKTLLYDMAVTQALQ